MIKIVKFFLKINIEVKMHYVVFKMIDIWLKKIGRID